MHAATMWLARDVTGWCMHHRQMHACTACYAPRCHRLMHVDTAWALKFQVCRGHTFTPATLAQVLPKPHISVEVKVYYPPNISKLWLQFWKDWKFLWPAGGTTTYSMTALCIHRLYCETQHKLLSAECRIWLLLCWNVLFWVSLCSCIG